MAVTIGGVTRVTLEFLVCSGDPERTALPFYQEERARIDRSIKKDVKEVSEAEKVVL
tara:strand:- start:202 stop:372 length:171 start_codon:yes stop_codon:yes gene_type:complete